MQKKGQIQTIKLVMGLVIIAIVVIAFIIILANIGGIFGKKEEVAARGNFDFLLSAMGEILKDENLFAFKTTSPIQIPDDFIVVGFDANCRSDGGGGCPLSICWDENPVPKPKVCGDGACICLFKESGGTDDFDDGEQEENLMVCSPISSDNKKVTISGPADNFYNLPSCKDKKGEEEYSDNCQNDGGKKSVTSFFSDDEFKYEDLVIYGDCDDAWKIRSMYFEKYEDKDSVYLFISGEEYKSERGNGYLWKIKTHLLDSAKTIDDLAKVAEGFPVDDFMLLNSLKLIAELHNKKGDKENFEKAKGEYLSNLKGLPRYEFKGQEYAALCVRDKLQEAIILAEPDFCDAKGYMLVGNFRIWPPLGWSGMIYTSAGVHRTNLLWVSLCVKQSFFEEFKDDFNASKPPVYLGILNTKDDTCDDKDYVNAGHFRSPLFYTGKGDATGEAPNIEVYRETGIVQIGGWDYAAICVYKEWINKLGYIPVYLDRLWIGDTCVDSKYKNAGHFRSLTKQDGAWLNNGNIYQTIVDPNVTSEQVP